MDKKIIDVSPPNGERKTRIIEPDRICEEPSKKRRGGRLLIILGVFLILALGVYFTSPFYSTLILHLSPKTETHTFVAELEISQSQSVLDFQNKIIPGKFFDEEKETTEVFETQGRDFEEGKAEGTIQVYNSYNPPRAVILRATTRFLSSEQGKIFRCPDKIYLPPAQIKNGKIVPSASTVKVSAQEAGEDYNIGPSKFSLPGLVGSALYFSVWAESTQPMAGGFRRETAMVSAEDLESGRNSLKESLVKTALASLKSKLPQDYVLLDNSSFVEDFQFACQEQAGTKVQSFNCQGKLKIKILSFKFSDIKEIIHQELKKELSLQKTFNQQSLALEFSPQNLVSETGKMILEVSARIDLYDKILEQELISRIKGKPEYEAGDIIFKEYPEITKLKFEFWPFWVNAVPKSPQKIGILFDFASNEPH